MADLTLNPRPSELEVSQRRLRKLENDIVADASEVVAAAMRFHDVDPEAEDPKAVPPEWVAELGEKEATKRHRIARAAWMSAKDAPVALKMAQAVITGSIKANATREAAPRSLNVALVSIVAPVQFPEKVIENE